MSVPAADTLLFRIEKASFGALEGRGLKPAEGLCGLIPLLVLCLLGSNKHPTSNEQTKTSKPARTTRNKPHMKNNHHQQKTNKKARTHSKTTKYSNKHQQTQQTRSQRTSKKTRNNYN